MLLEPQAAVLTFLRDSDDDGQWYVLLGGKGKRFALDLDNEVDGTLSAILDDILLEGS